MRLFTVETTITDEGGAEALADAMDRLQPAPADVALYDDAEAPGSIKVMGQFTSAPDMVVLDVLAVAFGAPPFTLSEQVQRTISALTTLPGEAAARALADLVEAMEPAPYGVGAFEIEDGSGLWEVGAYFLTDPDTAALNALGAAQGARPFVVSEVPDIDWVAKVRRELSPVDAGRFFVFGSHDADKVPAGRIPLQIEATVAFGTGHHNTTLGCLLAFDRMIGAGCARPMSPISVRARQCWRWRRPRSCPGRRSWPATSTRWRWMWRGPILASTVWRGGLLASRRRALTIRPSARPHLSIWSLPIS